MNAYDVVYHYPQSAVGQPGESGILGHRTTYSKLFININALEPGGKVIIKDHTLKKIYTYEITLTVMISGGITKPNP